MFSKKSEFITAKFCIFFLISIFALTFIRILSRTIILKTDRELSFGKIIFFDREDLQIPDSMPNPRRMVWSKRYPFLEDIENEDRLEIQNKTIPNNKEYKIIKLEIKSITSITEKIQTWVEDNFVLRNKFINLCSIMNSFFRWEPETFLKVCKTDVNKKVESLKSFNNFLKTRNIPFLYIQAPQKIDPNNRKLSDVYDFTNQITDEFLCKISSYNINFIDMRKEIKKTDKDIYSFFYKTDHHWTAESGLWATKIIAEKLNSDFVLNIDTSIYNTENFKYTVYEKSFLGSTGREKRFPLKYMEDITLIEPKENYLLTANIYSSNEIIREATGGFETLIFKEHLQDTANAYTESAYAMYVDGDNIMQITNHSSKSKVHILILGDSFTDVVEPFLCLGVKQLDCIDLRVFNINLRAWIDNNEHYDACIFLVHIGTVTTEANKALWDFDFR